MYKIRNKEYRRDVRRKAIERRKRIISMSRTDSLPHFAQSYAQVLDSCKNGQLKGYDPKMLSRYGDSSGMWVQKHDGQLAKGKIHCSCWMCSFHGVTRQDARRAGSMADEILEYTGKSFPEAECLRKEARM